MSTARHHTEWLSLVEASGPFLSLPVLLKAFSAGLDAHDPEHLKLLRLAHEEWLDSQFGARADTAIHRAWIEFVLKQTLEFPDEVLLSGQSIPTGLCANVAEHGETLRPDWVIVNPSGTPESGTPRLLIQIVAADQNLEKHLKGSRWQASPATRMMELLHACNVRLGIVTNGEQWMLVNAPRGETTGFISWYSNLWLEEHLTLRAFRSLLGVRRFFGVDEAQTLEALLTESLNDQQEVTDRLGYQVRRAVEVLVQAIDHIDQDRDRTLLSGIPETQLYEAALTIMMRLVFLFSAEERGLLLLGDPLYDQYYAVSTIREQLQLKADKEGEEILERRYDAWCRLLATFRAVHDGVRYDTLNLPAYGGSLFDPDRFPFLEDRAQGTNWKQNAAEPISVNNRIVLHLLEALQILQIRIAGSLEPRRLSFRALDIEQIGHVYEGLLDHTAVRATSPVLGLAGTREQEPEVELETLEAYLGRGENELLKFLTRQTGRSPAALSKALSIEISPQEQERFRSACNNDLELWERVMKFAGLVKLDTLGYPVVIPTGSVYVTQGADRRNTGTHYTPRSLTEPIVQYTLEPLIYQGVIEGKPKEQWQLKSAKELLQLKICDLAMGSGAFLVQTCRYMAERLVEAWSAAELANPGKVVIAPEGTLSKSLPEECVIPKDNDERLIVARRLIADRCLYGVDKNPLAVEMAKLSLWLITLQKNRPFTFLDHAFKCGDSLIGVNLEQLSHWNLDTGSDKPELFVDQIRREIDKVVELRREISSLPVLTTQDQNRKASLLTEANARTHDLRTGCVLLLSSYFNDSSAAIQDTIRTQFLHVYRNGEDVPSDLKDINLGQLRPFHWELEFPEVFIDSAVTTFNPHKSKSPITNSPSPIPQNGFDALVGNPPFMGGSKITGALGTVYRDYLVKWIAKKRGNADICAYFFLRAKQLLNSSGGFGLIATNTIAQGDSREVGLDQLVANGCVISRAVQSRKWVGTASLEVAHVWLRQGSWQGGFILDEKPVTGITAFLTAPGGVTGNPYHLVANEGKSFNGSKVYGQGFVLTPEEAQALIAKDPRNQDVLFPYLNGEDLNSRPDQSPSRWVINFKDYPLDAEHDDPKKPKGAPYASDYPDCLAIVEEKVKPERDKNNRKERREKWWQYAEKAPALYNAIVGMSRVLVTAAVSPTTAFHFSDTGIVFAHKLIVFALNKVESLSVLQSTIHREWAYEYSSTLGGITLNYSPTDCFETFPFPTITINLNDIGDRYYNHRQLIMQTRQEGLTKTYNRFHNPDESADDIQQLRQLHVEMDNAVAAAYRWELDLDHNFHQTKQGLRYTISEPARREVLDLLLQLNHQRYAEEVEIGLHDENKKKSKLKSKKTKNQASPNQISLF